MSRFSMKELISGLLATQTKSNYERCVDPSTGEKFVYAASGREMRLSCVKGKYRGMTRKASLQIVKGEEVMIECVASFDFCSVYLVGGNQIVVPHEVTEASAEPRVVSNLNDAYYVAKFSALGTCEKVVDAETGLQVHLSVRDEQALFRHLEMDKGCSWGNYAIVHVLYPFMKSAKGGMSGIKRRVGQGTPRWDFSIDPLFGTETGYVHTA
jgi:hypothetical protein